MTRWKRAVSCGRRASAARPVELVSDPAGAGAALVLAEQFAQHDVKVKVKQVDPSIFNGPLRNSWSFSTGGSIGHPFLAAATGADGPLSQANRSNFRDPRFHELINQAMRTPDVEERKPLVHEAQQIQHDRGGLLIWGFSNTLDGIAPGVGGIKAERSHFPTWRFDRIWLNG